nr:DapH/DapD/GlmU-related protein [Nocardioides panaciterrulae]
MRVLFCTATHEIGPASRRAGEQVKADITVGDGVWIGAGAQVMPGVTIGDGCVIAAGTVVVRDCAPHGMYAGVPARRVRDLAA